MKDRYFGRRDRLRRLLSQSAAGAILVTNPVNVTYLTGFTGEDSYLLVAQAGDVLLSDFRYATQLEEECPGLELAIRRHDLTMPELTAKTVAAAKVRQLALEAESISWSLLETIREKIKRIETIPTSGLVEQLREIKDKEEISDLRASIQAAEKAFGVLRATLRPEKTEIELRNELEYQDAAVRGGGSQLSFDCRRGPRAPCLTRRRLTLGSARAASFWSIGAARAPSTGAT